MTSKDFFEKTQLYEPHFILIEIFKCRRFSQDVFFENWVSLRLASKCRLQSIRHHKLDNLDSLDYLVNLDSLDNLVNLDNLVTLVNIFKSKLSWVMWSLWPQCFWFYQLWLQRSWKFLKFMVEERNSS